MQRPFSVRLCDAPGTKLTSGDVRHSSAYEVEADIPIRPADFRV
jgi:hypothetical protein